MLLARAGLRVLVIDRSRYSVDTLSTNAPCGAASSSCTAGGCSTASSTPAPPPSAARPSTTTTRRWSSRSAPRTVSTRSTTAKRTVLDPLLVDAAAEAGAEVRYGVTAVGLRSDRRGRVAGIDGRDDAGRPVAVDAALVVGADGLHSTVARHVGSLVLRVGTGASAVYGYWSGVATDGYEWIFRTARRAGHPDRRRAGLRLRLGHARSHRARRPRRARGRARTGVAVDRGPGAGGVAPAASAPSPGSRAWCGGPGGPGGPSSAMPATGRTPSVPTG